MPRLAFAAVAVATVVPAAALRSNPLPPEASNRFVSPATGMAFVRVPPGTFTMGSPKDEAGRENEPQHEVTLSRAFFLGAHEVTRGQFARFVTATGYKTDAEADGKGGYGWDAGPRRWRDDPKFTWRTPGFDQADDHPVVSMSWHDAVAFAGWLSRADGRAYRLPTEAEWEYACRAGTRTRFHFEGGDEDMARFGNVGDAAHRRATGETGGIKADDGYAFTAPVGRYRANAFGLHDMHGNAMEWVADWRADYPPGRVTDPAGPSTGEARVIRGGHFGNDPERCRSALRWAVAPSVRTSSTGFRLAFTPPN